MSFTQEVTPGHAYLATFEVKKSEKQGSLLRRVKSMECGIPLRLQDITAKKDDITVAILNIPLTHMW